MIASMSASTDLVERALRRAAREPAWLSRACGLASDTIGSLLPFYLPLASRIAELRDAQSRTLIIGIQGPQGAGKSTLTALLQCVLQDLAQLSVACLSIDDLYLTRAERSVLAERVHPLFMTRGVPGTHDVQLGVQVLGALSVPGTSALPRFDKSQDDRMPQSAWPSVRSPCDVVLFEGLWIGLPPIEASALHEPINALEAREDAQGIWRGYANRALGAQYPALFAPCELLVHVQVPDFDCVKRWRGGAEHALRARLEAAGADTSRVMDEPTLARFFDHYERFTEHAMRVMPARADVVLQLDRAHRAVALRGRGISFVTPE
jgi:D-glycerate 3-kinase